MSKGRYSMSFTTGSLFHRESVKLAELFLDLGNWKSVRDTAIAGNLLQARTLNTLNRVCSEVISRLKNMCRDELRLLVGGTNQEQVYLLWIAFCRRYQFVAEFAVEVLRERYITLKADLNPEDFDSFFNRKSEWHPELDKISQATRFKLRQVVFRVLGEANLLTPNHLINAAMLGPRLLNILNAESPGDLMYFPIFESDLKGMMP